MASLNCRIPYKPGHTNKTCAPSNSNYLSPPVFLPRESSDILCRNVVTWRAARTQRAGGPRSRVPVWISRGEGRRRAVALQGRARLSAYGRLFAERTTKFWFIKVYRTIAQWYGLRKFGIRCVCTHVNTSISKLLAYRSGEQLKFS